MTNTEEPIPGVMFQVRHSSNVFAIPIRHVARIEPVERTVISLPRFPNHGVLFTQKNSGIIIAASKPPRAVAPAHLCRGCLPWPASLSEISTFAIMTLPTARRESKERVFTLADKNLSRQPDAEKLKIGPAAYIVNGHCFRKNKRLLDKETTRKTCGFP